MPKNDIISLFCFGREIGKLGYDEDRARSSFQYNPEFLKEGLYVNLFPMIVKRTPLAQTFDRFNTPTFRGLLPMIADSLPDAFGNTIFKAWLEAGNRSIEHLSVMEQLTYVGNRGMGALEYHPAKEVQGTPTIDIEQIAAVVQEVLNNKTNVRETVLDHQSLLNIFKIGTSAGGARPKILISEHNTTGAIIPGDITCSADYTHYLVKLGIDEDLHYSREVIEYTYYLAATAAGINMMPGKMIDGRHFATVRFDREEGKKKHVLTATGLTGFDFTDPKVSRYENLFDLAVYLKIPHKDIEQLYRRMVFNIVFANHDDHLKNHSFIYNEESDLWHLAPAYDLTYSLNPLIPFTRFSRALSVNDKRTGIGKKDLLYMANRYTVKNAEGIIAEVNEVSQAWADIAKEQNVPALIIKNISAHFSPL